MKFKASRLIKEIMAFASTDVLAKALPFILMPFLSYYLSPEDFGLATNFMLLSSLSNAFIGLSGYSFLAVNFYQSKNITQLTVNVLGLNFIMYLIVTLLAFALDDILYSLFQLPLVWVLLAVLTGFCLQIVEMTITSLRFRKQLRDYSKFQIGNAFVSTLLTILFVIILAWTWKGRVLSLFVTPLIFAVIGIFLIKHKASFLKSYPKKSGIISAAKYGIPLLPHKLSSWISSGVQKVLITRFVGLVDMGIFSFSQLIISALSVISSSIFGALSPEFYSRLTHIDITESYVEQKKLILLQLKVLFFALLAAILTYPIMFLAIKFIISENYQSSLEYIPFFLAAFVLGIFYNLVSVYIFHSRKVKFFGLLSLATSLLGVIINVVLIKYDGVIGAAYSVLIVAGIKAVATSIYSQKVYPMPWRKVFKI